MRKQAKAHLCNFDHLNMHSLQRPFKMSAYLSVSSTVSLHCRIRRCHYICTSVKGLRSRLKSIFTNFQMLTAVTGGLLVTESTLRGYPSWRCQILDTGSPTHVKFSRQQQILVRDTQAFQDPFTLTTCSPKPQSCLRRFQMCPTGI